MDTEMSVAIVWAINALKEIGEGVIGTEEYSQALLEAPDEVEPIVTGKQIGRAHV